MLGNFSYKNATKLYFGDDSLKYLNEELPKYGKNVQLIYGGGSIKRTGLYDEIIKILKENGKEVKKYNVGKILPVFIFFKDDKEVGRLNGEHKKEEFDKIIGDNL